PANGPPNACRTWDAYDAHGIACGTRPACTEFAVPDFALQAAQPQAHVCAGDDATFALDVLSQFGFDAPVTLALAGNPAGTSVDFSSNPVLPGNASTLTVGATGLVPAGSYPMRGSCVAAGSPGHDLERGLQVDSTVADVPLLQAPADPATGLPLQPVLEWLPVAKAAGYDVEVALDAALSQVVADVQALAATSWQVPALQPDTTYYWRVRA